MQRFIFGIEWEFYITKYDKQISFMDIEKSGIISQIKELLQNDFNGFFQIKKENGLGQFEITSIIADNYNLLCNNFNNLKAKFSVIFQNCNLKINFLPQPFNNDCGNALQLNINIEKDGVNIFDKIANKESDYLLFAIGGILNRHQKDLLGVISNNNINYDRYSLQLNRNIFRLGKYCSPTRINWGYDNRSCLIRVIGKGQNRRLEYRGANADCNLKNIIEKTIDAMKFGLENKITPIQPCYGNSFDEIYNKIYQNIIS